MLPQREHLWENKLNVKETILKKINVSFIVLLCLGKYNSSIPIFFFTHFIYMDKSS